MNIGEYLKITNFLSEEVIPDGIDNASNFRRKCSKYKLNSRGALTYNRKIVVKIDELDRVWAEVTIFLQK